MSSSKRKKERRQLRYERNVRREQEHKKAAWEAGKLIEENHNQGPYSVQYCIELADRLVQRVSGFTKAPDMDPERFLVKYRLYKNKIRDLVLYWNPECPESWEYHFLKESLEFYWDTPNQLYSVVVNKIIDHGK